MDVLSFGFGGRLLRQAAYARAAAIEIVTLTGHVLRYPTGIFQERIAQSIASGGDGTQRTPRIPIAGLGHPPVLLLHGFVDNRSVFAPLSRSLRQHGWTHVQALNYSPLTCDIRTAAALLSRHVERICEQSGHRHVDIISHSLGGLIARYYVQRLRGDVRVRTLVTLGTPHSGTTAVPLLNPHPIVRQMRPGSDLMDELTEPAPHCLTRFVAFWSDLDEMMIPVETARLDHPDLIKENVHISGMGHLTMPAHSSIAAGIRQALVGEPPTPGAADAA
ncbi:alpha/beta fold hydrolase [Actinacidiphila oryziradicis]|jgi:pimeloyl-ACP methyl ester carboxylesterase|uniref:esterase/lipase family protein n=1 Tax=Actinacidiphila oryziradicis TaxID=2571141 RepID=UPI0023F477F0|nr:alpha/beta fold hydrolase [Actinacidiphila oryziradicis]MCW2869525.1 Alpha/beta hydrolase fold [Actinacidiphila oryziradicis]